MSFLRMSLAVLALAASFGSAQAFNPQPDKSRAVRPQDADPRDALNAQ